MNHDHAFHNTGSTPILLAHNRRSDARRSTRATIWLLDEDLTGAVEFGAVANISRGGLGIAPSEDLCRSLEAAKPGQEWLVMLDDPTGLEPLADQRIALIQLLRVEFDFCGEIRLACKFVTRRVGRCLPGRAQGLGAEGEAISDVVAGDMLDELAQRVQRDVAATIRSGAF